MLSATVLVIDVLGRNITEWWLSDASRLRILAGGFVSTFVVGPSMVFSSNLMLSSSKNFMVVPLHAV